MRGGVAVSADGGRARDGEALLGPDDVHHALPLVAHAKVGQVERLNVRLEREHLAQATQGGGA